MRVDIVGGGPAGLFLAFLLKEQRKETCIRIWERHTRQRMLGWGIVWSARALNAIEKISPVFYKEIHPLLASWEDVVVVHRGNTIRVEGHHFYSCARTTLLETLYKLCLERDIHIEFDARIDDPRTLVKQTDLLVGADGAGSVVREAFHGFHPSVTIRPNPYLWLGTTQAFDGLNLIFKETPHGAFCAHAYRFNSDFSTFIVECSSTTLTQSGLDQCNQETLLRSLAEIFEDSLKGSPLLLGQSGARWTQFSVVKNERWFVDNVVLLGDALHTAHFSIGSGTSLALESAGALANCLGEYYDVPTALTQFEIRRKPDVIKLQMSAEASMQWFEDIDNKIRLEPLSMAYSCITRSGRLDTAVLRKRSPKFVEMLERSNGIEI